MIGFTSIMQGKEGIQKVDAKRTPSYSSGLHISVFQDRFERGAFNMSEKALKLVLLGITVGAA